VTLWPLGALRVTVKLAPDALPSETSVSAMVISGVPSSSVIVPTAWPSARVAFVAFVRFRKNLSVTSLSRSPLTVTVTVFVVSPGVKVSPLLVAR
jgi:hypothetical protein